MNEEKKLKPVIFYKGNYCEYYRQNTEEQNKLLEAMSVSNNPSDWKKIVGFRTMADLYRTLDKLAIRKEYHKALTRQGINLDNIIKGIKSLSENSKSDVVKLQAHQTFLRSLGLDKYIDVQEGGQSWEDMIAKGSGRENIVDDKEINEADYEVIEPEVPNKEKQKKEEESRIGRELYE